MSRTTGRTTQLAYSEIQALTHDVARRRRKAAKIVRVLQHFLGPEGLDGKVAVDIGCSTGYTAEALSRAGCTTLGLDVDIPGLRHARQAFGGESAFLCADGSALPLASGSVDIVVFNHIYEHVVDPDRVLEEIRRVLKEDGLAYFGFGNRLQVMEPHYRLPFLSWLSRPLANRYIRRAGIAEEYYERFRTRPALKRMCAPLNLWDYTWTVLADPEQFAAEDVAPGLLARLHPAVTRTAAPIVPTYLWVGTPGCRQPAGPPTRVRPRRLRPVT